MLTIAGLNILINPLPSLGRIAIEFELNTIMTNASPFVHCKSSIIKLVFPLLSNGGLSSVVMKLNTLIAVDIYVSKLENTI
jgi:hypothetical protein